ncbi:hypothetical protein DENSPDRAFT_838535 [Dentipellis sp. KUC8613]|nr:hypothetical protein DENSPDRAFT_838535 [Dentipellis sp. KUC8613]
MVELEHEIRGVPPNPKTGFLVRTLRAIFHFTMPDCAIWEFAEVVRPMHPLAHENPLAQWLPKTVEASFLLLHPVFDFPSGEHASADACSSSAPSNKRSSIGSQDESVGSSASSRDDGPSLDHASNSTSRSSPMSMKSHEDGGRMAEEHIKMMDEKGETDEMDDTDEMDGTDNTDNTDDMDGTDGTDGADREDQTDGEDGAESASEVDDPESLSPGSESSASADGLNPIASQIHMLSDPTQRPMPLLGLLCMADVDNIFDVMASMLHQRRAWGLSNQPVVGLAFDRYQTSVQVVFGWFDDSDVSQPYCVPLPHVAYAAPGCTAREKGGIFDLADPSSAEALATFLLGLRERIESIGAECDARAEDVFAQVVSGAIPVWRADGPVPVMDGDTIRSRAADEDEIGHEQGAWWRTINSWVEDVNAARCDRRISRRSKSQDESSAQGVMTRSKTASEVSSKNQSSGKAPEKPTSQPSAGSKSRKSKHQSSLPTENRAKRYSASEFAREKAINAGNIEIHRIYLWMLDRNATSHSFCPTTFVRQAGGDPWISSTLLHFEAYEAYTALYMPSAWVENPPIESLTSEEGAAFRTFLTGPEVKQRRKKDTEAGRISTFCPLGDDKSDLWLVECLSQCLPSIFLALAQMECNKETQRYRTVSEMAWRQGWDLISSAVSVNLARVNTGSGNTVMHNMIERVLRLPVIDPSIVYPADRKSYLDMPAASTAHSTNLQKEMRLASNNLDRLEEAYNNNMTPSHARALADARTWYEATVQAVRASSRLFDLWETRREKLSLSEVEAAEPLTAKCDGLGVVRIEGFFKDVKRGWVNSFALVSRPKPSKKNKTDDQQTEVNNAAGRDIDAPPLADKGNAKPLDSASATHGMFVKRGPIPPTAHSDVMFSAVFRTAAHIEPAPKLPGSSLRPPLSDVSTAQAVDTLADKLADTHIRASVGEAKAKQVNAEGVEDASRTNLDDESDDSDPNQEAEDEVVLDEKESLEIPILIREYKKMVSLVEETAGNQAHLDLVAVVKFLGVLGITDFPIFGIISEAAMGVVACAWGEKIPKSKEIRVRIIDRNLRGFDLATVEGVFNYASFVAKLQKEHAPKLARLFQEKAIRATVLRDYEKDSSEDTAPLRWNIYQKVRKMKKNASSGESKGKQKA